MDRGKIEQRGNDARRILLDPILAEAFEAIEAEAIEDMLKASAFLGLGDRRRRRAADRIHTIRKVRPHLQMLVASGGQAHKGPPRVP